MTGDPRTAAALLIPSIALNALILFSISTPMDTRETGPTSILEFQFSMEYESTKTTILAMMAEDSIKQKRATNFLLLP